MHRLIDYGITFDRTSKEKKPSISFIHSPIIHFHVLPIEKEDSGGDVADVKVSCVDGSFIHINDVDGRHVAQVMGRF